MGTKMNPWVRVYSYLGVAVAILAMAGLLFLAGCQTSPAPSDPKAIWCETNSPWRPSIAVIEAMSRAELDELNSFNSRGEAWCGWSP